MAYTQHHSANWSEGSFTGNNPLGVTGNNTESISWADIEKALDPGSSLTGSNYGKGALARAESPTADSGFGLAQEGVSPFRGLNDQVNFFDSARRDNSDALVAEPQPKAGPRLNSSLLKVLGNMQRREAAPQAPADIAAVERALTVETPDAKMSIGLAIAPNADVHDKGKVARAIVRLPESQSVDARIGAVLTTDETVQARLEQEETRPILDPFRHVADMTAEIKAKFDDSNVKYGRTTLRPNGDTVVVQTAADNTTLTTTKSEDGSTSQVVHDRYRRPTTEQITNPDGTWSFSNLSYDDAKGIKPFAFEKLTINSDGTVVRSKLSKIGQVESKQLFS